MDGYGMRGRRKCSWEQEVIQWMSSGYEAEVSARGKWGGVLERSGVGSGVELDGVELKGEVWWERVIWSEVHLLSDSASDPNHSSHP